MILSLKVDDVLTSNLEIIRNHVESFYSQVYRSEFNKDNCSDFFESVKQNVLRISCQFRDFCDDELTKHELVTAIRSMQK